LVTNITYSVTRQASVDRYLIDENNKKAMQRLEGYEVTPNVQGATRPTWVSMGDTLYSTSEYRYLYPYYSSSCDKIKGSFLKMPNIIPTYRGNLRPAISANATAGDSLNFYPAFHDLPICMSNVGPIFGGNASFQIFFRPLVPSDSLESLTTPAGTFTCINFGSQWWAEGVGMIQSYHEGEAAFYDSYQHLQTGLLKWKRTLKSYHLE
jgi:hypothetical protein